MLQRDRSGDQSHGYERRGGGGGRHQTERDDPDPSKCVGVFGLSLYTTEKELEREFSKFGAMEKCQVRNY